MGSDHRHPRHQPPPDAYGRLISERRSSSWRSGRAPHGIEEPRLPRRTSWAAPPVVTPTRLRAAGTNPITAMQALTTDEAPTKGLTLNALCRCAGGGPERSRPPLDQIKLPRLRGLSYSRWCCHIPRIRNRTQTAAFWFRRSDRSVHPQTCPGTSPVARLRNARCSRPT